ncbi:MAG TPA: hypothetical protein VI320_25880 [Terracidiphilus sp.]|jgi:hypothetical protein
MSAPIESFLSRLFEFLNRPGIAGLDFPLYPPIISACSTYATPGPAITPSAARDAERQFLPPFEALPDTWIIADNPLCGSKYRYLPAGIFRGRLSHWLSILFKTGPACD